jgi:hypothetical protein
MTRPDDGRALAARDADLWKHVRSAYSAVLSISKDRVEGGRYIPTRSRASLGTFAGGWPNLISPSPTAAGEIHPSRLFGFKPAGDDVYSFMTDYSEVPELVQLVDHVRSRSDLRSRLSVWRDQIPQDDEEKRRVGLRVEQSEICNLPLEILDRTYALGRFDDQTVLDLYLQLETARLETQLDVELIVPLLLTAFKPDELIELDEDILLRPLSIDEQLARATQSNAVRGVPEPLIGAATHALVITNQTIENSSRSHRLLNGLAGQVSLELIDIACQAIAICTSRQTGYSQVLFHCVDWADTWKHDLPAFEEVLVLRRYPDQFDNYGWLSPREFLPIEEVESLPATFQRLRNAKPKVKLAARRLLTARTRPSDEDKIIDACIGLEALLGEGRDELTHRMALRAAAVLATRETRQMKAAVTYKLTKVVYDYRSSIVHGGVDGKKAKAKLGDQEYRTVDLALLLLRELLWDQLNGSPADWTPADLDGRLFTALDSEYAGDGDE